MSDNPESFETALHELENVVSALESGGVPLEKSLELLQHGLELAKRCETTLAQAELALEKLVMTADGELVTEKMEGGEVFPSPRPSGTPLPEGEG